MSLKFTIFLYPVFIRQCLIRPLWRKYSQINVRVLSLFVPLIAVNRPVGDQYLYPDMELITADCRDEFEILYWRGQNQVRSDGSGKLDGNDFEGNVTQSAAMFETGWLKMSQNAQLLLRLGGVSRQPTWLRWRGTCLGVTTAVSLRGWGHVQSQLAAQCTSYWRELVWLPSPWSASVFSKLIWNSIK